MRGTIDKVYENKSRSKGQRYLTAEIGGERYNVWDEALFDAVKPGVAIEFDVRKNGKYASIMSLNLLDGGALPLPGGQDGLRDAEYRHREIRKMSCLGAASRLVNGHDMSSVDDPVGYVVGLARRFEEYVSERDRPADKQEAPAPDAAPPAQETAPSDGKKKEGHPFEGLIE